MKKIYFIKNEDDFRSLMVDLEKEGVRWMSGHKLTHWDYSYPYNLIYLANGKITCGTLDEFLERIGEFGVAEEIHIIPYSTKPENIGYSFKEILDMDWDEDWGVEFYHPVFGERFAGLLDGLMFVLNDYKPSEVHKILSEAKFYIDKDRDKSHK